MKLILVRHGETIWNKENKIQGITDIGLNERGIEQAEKLAYSLQKEELDAIITSPLRRAYDTAQAIGKLRQSGRKPPPEIEYALVFPDMLAYMLKVITEQHHLAVNTGQI